MKFFRESEGASERRIHDLYRFGKLFVALLSLVGLLVLAAMNQPNSENMQASVLHAQGIQGVMESHEDGHHRPEEGSEKNHITPE